MQQRWARLISSAGAVAWLSGCGPLVLPEGETETESHDGSTSSPPPGTTTAPPPPGTTTSPPPPPPSTTDMPPGDESTSGDPVTSISFLDGFDPGGSVLECNVFEQDCPRGEKCMPWANDGGTTWNALRCAPIAGDPDAVGEPCTVEGSPTSGIDSCEAGSMCWNVDVDTNMGHCVAFCMGDESNPLCEDPGTSCLIGSDTVLALCYPLCNPLVQDCFAEEGCYPLYDAFACAIDESGAMGAAGEPCEYANVCDPGTFCANAEVVPDCMDPVGCCSSFCDLTVDPPPCLPGQECMPWYEAGQAPPGHETLGACSLPP